MQASILKTRVDVFHVGKIYILITFSSYGDGDDFIDFISWCRRQHLQCRCRKDKSIQHDQDLWCHIYGAFKVNEWKRCVALKTSKHARQSTTSQQNQRQFGTTSTADWLLTWHTHGPDIKNGLFSILTVHLEILHKGRPKSSLQNCKQIELWRKGFGEILRRYCGISVLDEFRANCILQCKRYLTSTCFTWCW